jgi:transcriptional regulator with XRE-family HTH domain
MSNTNYDNLKKLVSDQPSSWREKAELRKGKKRWLKRSSIVALKVLEALRIRGMKQSDLAQLLGVSPQQVSKIVKGQENLTIETLDKLEEVLKINLLVNHKVEPAIQVSLGEIANTLKQQLTAHLGTSSRFFGGHYSQPAKMYLGYGILGSSKEIYVSQENLIGTRLSFWNAPNECETPWAFVNTIKKENLTTWVEKYTEQS